MLYFLGFIIGLAATIALVLKMIYAPSDSENPKPRSEFEEFLDRMKKRSLLATLVAGVVIFMLPYMFFFADRGHSYLLVYPTGSMDAVLTQGIKPRWFAKIDEWQQYIDVKVVDTEAHQEDGGGEKIEVDLDEIEGVVSPIGLRFTDQVTGDGYVSTRFELPRTKEAFIALAVKYRTMTNLVDNTIVPTVREQLINTGYMFAAQDYISGEAQAFRQTYEDQLKGGTYAVKKVEYRDTIYADIQEGNRRIKEVQTRYQVVKVMENGLPKRIPHELSENNIIVSQVIVDRIKLEPTFRQRLEAQRDESAKRQLEQQKIETAKAAQLRIQAEGERDKTAERVAQEKEQVQKLIAIETKLKEEQTNKELAAIQLETERLSAQRRKVAADATYYENTKKVQAGLTPQERVEFEIEVADRVSKNLATWEGPNVLFMGEQGKQSDGLLTNLVAADYANLRLNMERVAKE